MEEKKKKVREMEKKIWFTLLFGLKRNWKKYIIGKMIN